MSSCSFPPCHGLWTHDLHPKYITSPLFKTLCMPLLTIPSTHAVPSSAPSDIYTAVKSSTLLWLHWSPPPDIGINGIITYYIVIGTEVNTGRNWTFVAVGNVLRVGSLRPGYVYSFTVAARTFGNGPYSVPINVRTLEEGKHLSYLMPLYCYSFSKLEIITKLKLCMVRKCFFLYTVDEIILYCYLKCESIPKFFTSSCICSLLAAPTSPPQNVVVVSKTSQSFTLSWQSPPLEMRNGHIRFYTITITEMETDVISDVFANTTDLTISGLHPYYHYDAKVKGKTVAYGPYSASVTVQLDEDGMVI